MPNISTSCTDRRAEWRRTPGVGHGHEQPEASRWRPSRTRPRHTTADHGAPQVTTDNRTTAPRCKRRNQHSAHDHEKSGWSTRPTHPFSVSVSARCWRRAPSPGCRTRMRCSKENAKPAGYCALNYANNELSRRLLTNSVSSRLQSRGNWPCSGHPEGPAYRRGAAKGNT
jgi:hypothetical protein